VPLCSDASRDKPLTISIRGWPLLLGLLLLARCAAGPSPRVYVLDGQEDRTPGVASDSGRPVVELKSVLLPDYLDTTDIVLRDGQNELKTSQTGRWGERLSVGVTRLLGQDLARRMPAIVVDQSESARHPARTLLINVDGFDVWPDRRCVLTAHWTITGEDGRSLGAGEKATIVALVPQSSNGPADSAIVQAMTDAVGQLADHVANDLSRTLRNFDSRSRAPSGD
jgi:uncharacterized lipoprotein YmbA